MWPFRFTGFCWRRFESRRKSLLNALLTMFLSSATSLSNVHTLVVIQSIIFYKFVTFSSNLPSNRFVKRTTFFRNYSFRFRLERGNSSIASFGFFIRSRRPVCVRTDEKNASKSVKMEPTRSRNRSRSVRADVAIGRSRVPIPLLHST